MESTDMFPRNIFKLVLMNMRFGITTENKAVECLTFSLTRSHA